MKLTVSHLVDYLRRVAESKGDFCKVCIYGDGSGYFQVGIDGMDGVFDDFHNTKELEKYFIDDRILQCEEEIKLLKELKNVQS